MPLGRRAAVVLSAVALAMLAGCSAAPAQAPGAPAGTSSSPAAPGTPAPTALPPGPSAPVGPTSPAGPSEGTPSSPENFPDADRLAFPVPTTDLPTITVATLPPQAVATLRVIKDGGPYPYAQDGMIFQNRERELPQQPEGFYHEFTVPTPGSPDRGPRRIVSGADGALFWTTDHYRSFREIIEPWT